MTWAPAIDVENASAHASKVSISFNEGILIVTSSRICRSQRQRDSFILLKDDGDQGRSRAERRLLPVSRQTFPYRIMEGLPVIHSVGLTALFLGGTSGKFASTDKNSISEHGSEPRIATERPPPAPGERLRAGVQSQIVRRIRNHMFHPLTRFAVPDAQSPGRPVNQLHPLRSRAT